MDSRPLALVALAACGRISFDARSDASSIVGDGRSDGGGSLGDAPLPPGLVAYYPIDDLVNGNQFFDFSGNQLHGTCPVSCPTSVAGHAGGTAFHFNGSTNYLTAGGAGTALDIAGDFTVAAWVRPMRAPSGFEIFVSRALGTGAGDTFALDIDSTRRAEYYSHGNTSLFSAGTLPLSQWSHLAITWTPPQTTRIYVDGALAGMGTDAATPTWDNYPLTFGADIENGGSVNYFLLGDLDDVMLFDRALTDPEIADLASR